MTGASYDPAIVLASCPIPLLIVDGEERILFASTAAHGLWETDALIGSRVDAFLTPYTRSSGEDVQIYAARQTGQYFDVRSVSIGDADHRLLALHDVTAYAKELARLNRLALTDPLTRLTNRRGFLSALRREHRRMIREKKSLSLLAIDIDGLKSRNDTYGHAAGDVWLRAVADALVGATFRPGDIAARLGGDEFALLLPETDRDGARTVAVRIRRLLAMSGAEGDAPPTVGIGIATMASDQPVLHSPASLLHAADADLYRARARPLLRSEG